MIARLAIAAVLAAMLAVPAAAQNPPAAPAAPAAPSAGGGAQLTSNPGNGKPPLTVSADNGVEWQKDTQLYIARGNAIATRGDLKVRADTLTAHYREVAGGKTEIFRVDAVGGVVLQQSGGTATGGQGVYDVDTKSLRLTGGNLSYTSNDSKITARDSLEYQENQKQAVARGNAVATRGSDTVRADVLTGHFADGGGKHSLSRIEATGNVVVTSNQNIAYAERGTYDPNTKIANLDGKVRINRGADQLLGERAEVNMATGTYKLLPGASGGRVTGVIQPDQKLDTTPGATPPAATPPGGAKPKAKPTAPTPPSKP
jgi:lipopolysaccharide export system protein LptA